MRRINKHTEYSCILKRVLALLYILSCLHSSAATPKQKLDSLFLLLKKDKDDTIKAKHLDAICANYLRLGNAKMVNLYADSMVSLSQKINYQRGIAKAYVHYGNAYLSIGEHDKALEYERKALKIDNEIGSKDGAASVTGDIGNVYEQLGDYVKALEYFSEALQMCQEIGDKNGEAVDNNNIGIIYAEQGDYTKSLDYFLRALKIDREKGDKVNMAMATGNIGIIYTRLGEFNKALETYLDALKINEELGDKSGIAVNKGNIGGIYSHLDNPKKALEYLQDALKIAEEIGNKYLQMNNLTNIGNAYKDLNGKDTSYTSYYFRALKIAYETSNKGLQEKVLAVIGEAYSFQKNYKKSISFLSQSLKVGLAIGDMDAVQLVYSNLSDAYSKTGDWQNAYLNYFQACKIRDSISSQQKTREIGRLEAKADYDKQFVLQKANEDKMTALANAESKRQRIFIWLATAIAAAIAIIAIIIFQSLKTTRSQKKLIEMQKMSVEQQKKLVEEKNREVLDSITYAKRLQDAILPSLRTIKKHLPESFVLYKPKDIVAGDFYWMWSGVTSPASSPGESKDGILLIAACDCTGHGVPGAMVSVVCSNALNRTVKELHITEPGKILDKVRELVTETFERSESDVTDGMDISLGCLDTKTGKLLWSGANTPLWYTIGGALVELAPDKQPIGKQEGQKPFSTHAIDLQKGNTFYLFTDGFADQFGGPKGKKFKYKQFQDTLLSLSKATMDEQKQKLNEVFENWKGNLDQVDDILVIGVRI